MELIRPIKLQCFVFPFYQIFGITWAFTSSEASFLSQKSQLPLKHTPSNSFLFILFSCTVTLIIVTRTALGHWIQIRYKWKTDRTYNALTTLVSPLRPWMKSDHLYTVPSPDRQDFDIRSVSAGDSTWSHTLTFASIPMKVWLTSKPPPKVSCSRANVSDPPDFITWPLFNAFPCAATAPSLYNFYEPLIFSQDEQTWCHFLSFVETEDGFASSNMRSKHSGSARSAAIL